MNGLNSESGRREFIKGCAQTAIVRRALLGAQ